MDKKDLLIAKKLLENCRITYRELAEILDLSVNAVYKRVQNMVDSGLILAFTAKPSLIALDSIEILTFGKTKSQNLDKLSKRLGEHESVYFVGLAAGNMIYIGAYLRNISKLHEFTTFITKTADLTDSKTCIKKSPYRESPEELKSLDYEVLKGLRLDARRSISDLADEIGVSAKTARRRIKKMMEYDLVEFSINFAPQMITSNFHIYLMRDKDYYTEYKRLEIKYADYILYLQQFSNLPNLIMMTSLTETNQESADLHRCLQQEDFEMLEHHIFYNGYFFETWRDKLYNKMINN
ncbi:MAG: AsnC family transcriptional regulator [Promethearchaeota archaeon]|nr:MAG: AsnC family transcriptional regulator [Candidatus Lokiarchaeota archaeon]